MGRCVYAEINCIRIHCVCICVCVAERGERRERERSITSVVGCASAKLKNSMAIDTSQALAWLTMLHLECPPHQSLMTLILDEFHEVIRYHFSQS